MSNFVTLPGNPGYCELTYEELKKLRDDSQLVPGIEYRITDYDTRIFKPGADSMHHRFDILVTALSEDTLSENCKAIRHNFTDDELNEYSEEEVHYFDGCDLDAWKIMYTIDNDTDRFDWVADGSVEYILAPIDMLTESYYHYHNLVRYPEGDLPDGSTGNTSGIGNFRYLYRDANSIYYEYFFDVSTLYDSSYSINIAYEANNMTPFRTFDYGMLMYSTELIEISGNNISNYISGDSSFNNDWEHTTILSNVYNYDSYGFHMGWFVRDTEEDDKFAAQGYDTSSGWFAYCHNSSNTKLWYNENADYCLVMTAAGGMTLFYKEYTASKYVFPKYGYVSTVTHRLDTDAVIDTAVKDITPAGTGGIICVYAGLDIDNGVPSSVSAKVLPFYIDTSVYRYCFPNEFGYERVYTQYKFIENETEEYVTYTDASVFEYSQEERIADFSKGVIYGMVDEYGNDMSYDFKNIVYEVFGDFLPTFSGDNPDRSSKRRALTKSGNDMSLSTGHTGNMFYTFSRIDSSFNIYDATLKPINIVPFDINGGSDNPGIIIEKGGENDVK